MRKTVVTIIIVVSIVVVWSAVVYFVGADRIVEYIGIENSYIVMFLVALFGGASSIGGATYMTTLITLAGGGANPVLLALASGLGTTIGDTVYFYIGHHGRSIIKSERINRYAEKFTHWLARRNKKTIWLSIYGITAFTPVPTDILTISLGLAKQPYLLVITALSLGNLTLAYLLAQFGTALIFI